VNDGLDWPGDKSHEAVLDVVFVDLDVTHVDGAFDLERVVTAVLHPIVMDEDVVSVVVGRDEILTRASDVIKRDVPIMRARAKVDARGAQIVGGSWRVLHVAPEDPLRVIAVDARPRQRDVVDGTADSTDGVIADPHLDVVEAHVVSSPIEDDGVLGLVDENVAQHNEAAGDQQPLGGLRENDLEVARVGLVFGEQSSVASFRRSQVGGRLQSDMDAHVTRIRRQRAWPASAFAALVSVPRCWM